jgi:hypothetical protein
MMIMNVSKQSEENREYVRMLLRQKQPGFAAALELAVERMRRELRDCDGGLPASFGAVTCA